LFLLCLLKKIKLDKNVTRSRIAYVMMIIQNSIIMAILNGLIQVKGTLGEFTYYMRDGVPCVRKVSRHAKGVVKTGDNYINTRLANREFTACSKLAADGYKQMTLHLPYLKHWYAMGKLTGCLRKVVNGSAAHVGERELSMSKHASLALGTQLNAKNKLQDVLVSPFVITYNAADKTLTYTVDTINPTRHINKTEGATLFRLVGCAMIIPDYSLDAAIDKYTPVSDFNSIKACFGFSEYIPLIQDKSIPVSFKIDFKDRIDSVQAVNGWAWLGVELCRRVNNRVEVLHNSSAFMLVQVVTG